jgi:putative transposase
MGFVGYSLASRGGGGGAGGRRGGGCGRGPRGGGLASRAAAILDTQSVKTAEQGGPRGYDAAKRVKGRKRHIAVDTQGLLLGVAVHAADIQDADGAADLLRRLKRLYCWLRAVFVDGLYDRLAVLLVCFLLGLALIIVRRSAGATGFVVLPRRWVVERTLGWLGRWRRLSKDYEELPDVSEAMITLAMIRLMLQRLAPPNRKRLPAP